MEPKIRFKGFEGEWKALPITEIASLKAGKSFNKLDAVDIPTVGYYPCYGGNGQRGYLPYYNQEGKYNIIGRQGALCGCINVAEGKFYATEHAVIVTPITITDFEFLHESLVRANINQYATGAAQPGISVTNVNSQLSLNYPLYKEQKAIGKYFTSLDSQISASTSRLASLKQMKAASLLAMFPQEGETVPKVRFKGFEGEWKKVKFSELYERSSIKNDLSFGADKIISVANMYFIKNSRQVDDDYLRSYNIMRLGDIAFEGNKSKDFAHGRLVENTIGDGIVSHVFVVMKPKSKKYDLNFWKYYINNENIMGNILIRSTKSSTMMTDLVIDDFLKESILVPSYEEQVEIGKILTSLDHQITLQTQRLEKLKQIKSACLDKMFV